MDTNSISSRFIQDSPHYYYITTKRNSKSHCKFLATLLFFTLIFCQTRPSHAGTCWLNVNKNGKCTAIIQMGTTKEDCCGKGILAKSVTAAYSEGEMSSSSIFIMHIQGGVQCTRCKETCDNVKCSDNKRCEIRNGIPKCVCSPDCTAFRQKNGLQSIRGPICGTDGHTYKNVCRMLKRSCRQKILISVAYSGPCKVSCSNLNCPGNKSCLMDQNMIPHCVNCIERKCVYGSLKKGDMQRSVCGIDENTYPTVCHIRQASCKKGKAIPIAYTGSCKKRATCDTIKCSETQTCLTEKLTGKPRCVNCSKKRWCKKFQRHQVTGPICSSNGKTYKNFCDMMDDACLSGTALDTRYFGQCKPRDRFKNLVEPDVN